MIVSARPTRFEIYVENETGSTALSYEVEKDKVMVGRAQHKGEDSSNSKRLRLMRIQVLMIELLRIYYKECVMIFHDQLSTAAYRIASDNGFLIDGTNHAVSATTLPLIEYARGTVDA
jgi:hypothetical protein